MLVSQQINVINVNSLNIILQNVKILLNVKSVLKIIISDNIIAFYIFK